MAPTEGVAKISGYDVFENPLEVKKRIGYLPETPPLYLDMTIQEYLSFVADLKQVPDHKKKALIKKSLMKTQLYADKQRLIRNLSKGFKQRVGIAQALVSDPEVLVLDEPTVGLDPKQVAEVRELIKELKGQHTIILSTHILSEVQATCDKVIIIHQGKIVAQNKIEEIEKLNQNLSVVHIKTRKEGNLSDKFRSLNGVVSVDIENSYSYKMGTKNLGNVAGVVKGLTPPLESDGSEKRYVLWAKEIPTNPASYQLMYYDITKNGWYPIIGASEADFNLIKHYIFGTLNLSEIPSILDERSVTNLIELFDNKADINHTHPDLEDYINDLS